MPLRLLVRATPFVLGAVALAIWLRRRQARQRAQPAPPPVPTPAPPPAPPKRQTTRFVRASEQRPVDIVTVVDDLLGVPG
jgi:hypothetical protein